MRPPRGAGPGDGAGRIPVVRVSGKGSGAGVCSRALACPEARRAVPVLLSACGCTAGGRGERRSMSEADYAALVTAAHHAPGRPGHPGLG